MALKHTIQHLAEYALHMARIETKLFNRKQLFTAKNDEHVTDVVENLKWARFYLDKAIKALKKIRPPPRQNSHK